VFGAPWTLLTWFGRRCPGEFPSHSFTAYSHLRSITTVARMPCLCSRREHTTRRFTFGPHGTETQNCLGRSGSGMALRKILVQFLSSFLLLHRQALEYGTCAALAKVQHTKPPLRMSSAFPNAEGTVEDTQVSCVMEMWLQREI